MFMRRSFYRHVAGLHLALIVLRFEPPFGSLEVRKVVQLEVFDGLAERGGINLQHKAFFVILSGKEGGGHVAVERFQSGACVDKGDTLIEDEIAQFVARKLGPVGNKAFK